VYHQTIAADNYANANIIAKTIITGKLPVNLLLLLFVGIIKAS